MTPHQPERGGDGAWPPANHGLKELLELPSIAGTPFGLANPQARDWSGRRSELRGRKQLAILLPFQNVIAPQVVAVEVKFHHGLAGSAGVVTDPSPQALEKTRQAAFRDDPVPRHTAVYTKNARPSFPSPILG